MRFGLVIFDMDGTLTEELLDFDAIRRDIGLPVGTPILEAIAQLTASHQARAHAILNDHEMTAASKAVLHEGAREVLVELRRHGVRTALLTRNSAACAQRVLTTHGLQLDWVATRENLPHKPHGGSILNIVHAMGITPTQTLMVGDYLYDLQAAANAGVASALLCLRQHRPAFADQATWCIDSLMEVLSLAGVGAAAGTKERPL
jgi:HAD superfamily hydrolase (TIGR01549 family)